jgi:hypothetical protein
MVSLFMRARQNQSQIVSASAQPARVQPHPAETQVLEIPLLAASPAVNHARAAKQSRVGSKANSIVTQFWD